MQFLGRMLNGIREMYVFGSPFESHWNPVPDSGIYNSRSMQKFEILVKMNYDLAEGYKEENQGVSGKEFKEGLLSPEICIWRLKI